MNNDKARGAKTCLSALFAGVMTVLAGAADAHEDTTASRTLLRAARVFDGKVLRENAEVLVSGNSILGIGKANELSSQDAHVIDLGDSTILPGFIELHGHIVFQNVDRDTVLRHGVTTVRDVGGPLRPASGGDGKLRLLTAGPIFTAPGGYPIPVFGNGDVAVEVGSAEQARQKVRDLIAGGAALIKVAIDPGGEAGAPWTTGHPASTPPPWPVLPLNVLQAITDEAHKNGRIVAAHISENTGATLSLDAGVDEWAHVPCLEIAEDLLKRAVDQRVKVVTTLDTMSHCPGVHPNTMKLAALGADFYYGAEIAHTDIPWGIDAEELHLILHMTGKTPLELFQMATAKAGQYLGLAPLGSLAPAAPADLIAVRGNPFTNFKPLEYPDLVMSGGKLVVNQYAVQYAAQTDCLLDWAETAYGDMLSPGGASTLSDSSYAYRYYRDSNAYVGVSSTDKHVYYRKGNAAIQDLGSLSDWLGKAGCQ